MKELLNKTSKLEPGIRTIFIINSKGEVLHYEERAGLKHIIPKKIFLESSPIWNAVLGGIAEKMGEFVGKPKRLLIHFDKIDLILIPSKDFMMALTVDKDVDSEELARKVKKILAPTKK